MTSFGILGILYVIILSFTVFLVVKLVKKGSLAKSLQQENSNLKEKVSGFRTFIPGRKGLIYNFGLVEQSATKTSFKVTYEVEIIEVSENKVKVSAYDFTSTDSFARDPKNKSNIIGFYQNQWVQKEVVELFIDKSDIRDSKIEQILS
jgi:hypothetical protein